MKLLIITQKIDKKDDVLGFMHGWIAAFAAQCDEVIAVGLFVGEYDLPKNVRVYSLGKESGVSRLKYLMNFYRIIIRERANYDSVFVHMNQVYVLLGGVLWRLFGKKIGLWYTHKQVSVSLQLATMMVDHVFTASVESFRIPTSKCHIVGHGIDTALYRSVEHVPDASFRILSIGRISRAKDYLTLLETVNLLSEKALRVKVSIVGAPLTEEDKIYAEDLRGYISERSLEKEVFLTGAVPNSEIRPLLARADLFVNMSLTGSLDKAVLEAMAAGVPVLTSNTGLKTTLDQFSEKCMFAERDIQDFAAHIEGFLKMPLSEREELGSRLCGVVSHEHDLSSLVPRILSFLAPVGSM